MAETITDPDTSTDALETPAHPALADPRADATAAQNRIDLNDPGLSGADGVEQALKIQREG